MEDKDILVNCSAYIKQYFEDHSKEFLTFHNLQHTEDVVAAVKEIATASNVTDDEMEMLQLAAWFHDIGYLSDPKNHEESGAKIAQKFLTEQDYPEERIKTVTSCILATKICFEDHNRLQQILSDADLAHLSKENYPIKSNSLAEERAFILNKKINRIEKLQCDLTFLLSHQYKTDYALTYFQKQKTKNVLYIQKQLAKVLEKNAAKKARKALKKELETSVEKEKKKEVDRQPLNINDSKYQLNDRGIQTMFRVTMRNHINLSAIADNKANIMLSINAIIISIIVTNIVPKMSKYQHLLIPVLMMLLTNVTTIIFAVFSTRPKVTSGTFTQESIENKTTNLLFFGNFFKMPLNDFETGFNYLMNNKDYLYDSLMRDFYYLGVVLGKKYKYLSLCYTFFAFGFVLSVFAFIIASFAKGI